MDINWDEAPEGATHYCIGSTHDTVWRDLSGVDAKYWYQGEWHRHEGANSEFCLKYGVFEERPVQQAWNGEGIPPVGSLCEVKSTARGKERDWFKAEVKYISPFTVVLDDFPTDWLLEGEFVVHPNTVQFRPIKTKEQIAAEERKEAVDMMRWICEEWVDSDLDRAWSWDEIFGVLHDAGYRKQENNDAKA